MLEHATALRRDTVLVVDDTPETLHLLTDTLDQAGFTVLIATDGETALDLVDQVTPDLVLMDARMPGISGFETCKRLKRDKLLSDLPVIFMTGLSETEHVIEGLACGGVDYVTKPIVLDVLLARIRVHLGNARLAYETRAALDASGRFLLATDRAGRVLWCTPKARQLLAAPTSAAPSLGATLPATVIEQLLRMRRGEHQAPARCLVDIGGRRLECSFLSPLGPDELLFRLAETANTDSDQAILQRAFALTSREAEVLLWISRGKPNRDIGEILNISPRTVNKHLEQIFVKLGVENRSAAAAAAVRTLTG
ncbi:MAG TPA: response regulator [Steroidobacteraceae bacterium]|jgi:DNA-binding response OmpR family regulator/DNA-binding CsgD family transcriptional regulator|nr:response regulator [Steroidobacteraceae bacterium]